MEIFDSLWTRKYQPNTLKDLVLSKENLDMFNTFRKEQNIPNLLFVGNPGTGKTTLSKVIVNDILDCQYMYINASDESGIDTIRNKVIGFAQTKSIDGKIKIIILDEGDSLTGDSQRILRNVMEEYSQITRFILTGNYLYRIIPALQSRCQNFDLTPPLDGILDRLKYILTTEQIKFNDKDIETIARENYPDLRKSIGQLQRYSKTGTLVIPTKTEVSAFVDKIFKLIKLGKILEVRKWIIENELRFGSDYQNLLRTMFNYIFEQKLPDDLKKKYLIIVSEYLYRASACLDQEINMFACLLQLAETKE